MKIKLSELRQVIREILAEAPSKNKLKKEPAPEQAPAKRPLGNIAFAELRADLYDDDYEQNTEIEDILQDELMQHFGVNKPMSPESAELLQNMLAKGWPKDYYKIFKAPSNTKIAFRGVRLPPAWFVKNIGSDWKAQFKKGKGSVELNTTFGSGNKPVASWTTDRSVATRFSAVRSDKKGVGVILHAKVSDNQNKFLDAKPMYKNVPEFSLYDYEAELLGIGDINIYKVELNTEPFTR